MPTKPRAYDFFGVGGKRAGVSNDGKRLGAPIDNRKNSVTSALPTLKGIGRGCGMGLWDPHSLSETALSLFHTGFL